MSRPEHGLASPATAARVRRSHRSGLKTSALSVFAVLTALPALCKAEPSLGKIDVALRRGPLADVSSLVARKLGRTTMVCVASRDVELDRRSSVESRIAAARWLRVGASSGAVALRGRIREPTAMHPQERRARSNAEAATERSMS